MPDVSFLYASYSDAPGFWIEEHGAPTTKNEEAKYLSTSPSLPSVDTAQELRSAQYSRSRAKNKPGFARAQESKRQGKPRRGYPIQRGKGGKRSGKRQPSPLDLATDSESDHEQNPSAFLAPVRIREGHPITPSISPELQPPVEKSLKEFTPPSVYTTATLPESTFNIPPPDAAREFRSYERHRHQTKKIAHFIRSRERKGARVKPALNRSSKSVKTENLQSLINLTVVDEQTSPEDDIQTPIEVPLSPDTECVGARTAVDMEALITTAKVKLTKGPFKSLASAISPFLTHYDVEPGFEFVKRVPPVVALDDLLDSEDQETWEHLWNDDLVDG